MAKELSRSSYLEKNVGSFPETIDVAGVKYEKVDDLRYGTNPHQTAAYYRPVGENGVIGNNGGAYFARYGESEFARFAEQSLFDENVVGF